MKSDTISELAKALSTFQGKMVAVKKDGINPFFKSKYATLDVIWETIRKPLSDNGLSVAQTMEFQGDTSTLNTTLLHTSGEWIMGAMRLNPVRDDPQGLGSAISYARRYSLSAMLGIVADEDDDANSTSTPAVKKEIQKNKMITVAQSKTMVAVVKERGIDKDEAVAYIKKTFNKNRSSELTEAEADKFIKYLEEGYLVKAAKEIGATGAGE